MSCNHTSKGDAITIENTVCSGRWGSAWKKPVKQSLLKWSWLTPKLRFWYQIGIFNRDICMGLNCILTYWSNCSGRPIQMKILWLGLDARWLGSMCCGAPRARGPVGNNLGVRIAVLEVEYSGVTCELCSHNWGLEIEGHDGRALERKETRNKSSQSNSYH